MRACLAWRRGLIRNNGIAPNAIREEDDLPAIWKLYGVGQTAVRREHHFDGFAHRLLRTQRSRVPAAKQRFVGSA